MLLAIDTATRTISLALHDGQRVLAENSWHTANHHTIELTPGVTQMLARLELSVQDLQGVAVALGPGSFTGLRIGLGVAKGMALAVGLPLLGVPTPDVLAFAQGPPINIEDEEEQLCVVLQAGRGRIVAALYGWTDGRWQATQIAFIVTWPELVQRLNNTPTRIVGELDDSGRELLRASGQRLSRLDGAASLRRAGYLAELGWQRLRRGEQDEAATLAPIYLHNPEGSIA